MILIGIYFGMAFDTYHRLFQRDKRKEWLVFLNDILFWLFQGLLVFYVLYEINQGEIRFYIFLALLCGFSAYQSLLKRGYLRLLEVIISTVLTIYRFFIKMMRLFIFEPIRVLVLFLISFTVIVLKGLLTLVKLFYRTLLLIMKVIFLPIKWLGLLLQKMIPNYVTVSVAKIYNKFKSLGCRFKMIVSKWLQRNTRK